MPFHALHDPYFCVDPGGLLYVSAGRLKQYGTVYRVDQEGNVLRKWPPLFFDARGLKMTSPWGTLNYDRHFRYPEEPLSIDSIFGKDGRVYRWKLGKAGVELLRLDRQGKPIPFKTTGSNALLVDHAMQTNFWHDVYHGMDIDRHGNILYVVCRPADRPWEEYLAPSKFSPSGGEPLWSRRWEGYIGGAEVMSAPCHCVTSRHHQTLDGKGYLYAAGKYSVQVIDCETGKLVGGFGSYRNMDCQGKGSKYPHPELPFGTISALSVWKDRLFVVDVLNRRIVKCRIVYGQAEKRGP